MKGRKDPHETLRHIHKIGNSPSTHCPGDSGDCGIDKKIASTPHKLTACVETSIQMISPVTWLPDPPLHQDVLLRLGLGFQDSLKYTELPDDIFPHASPRFLDSVSLWNAY